MRLFSDGTRCSCDVTRWRRLARPAAMVLGVALGLALVPSPAGASTEPPGFHDSVALSGLNNPTVVQFASDGRIFVGQKNGVIKVFQSLTDTNPVTVADLSGEVDDYWDRGLLGLALDPNFPASPYIYVLYAYDAPIGGTAPTWNDACPTPPGPTTDGCVVSARVSRLQIGGNVMTGTEQVLLSGWCQQFPSHSIGTLLFGRDGDLYVSGGDGASFNNVDYGQYGATYAGDQANPCGDPPGAVGTALSPPGAEGGALRSQSVRRTDGPATLNGTVLRIDPSTGAGVPGNPFYSSADANARRIVAYGLRNPFRITQRPGTDELWIGDVGWNTWEEINRVVQPASATASNFGWPCYEGASAQGGYQSAGLDLCNSLYSSPGSVVAPYYAYNHNACVVSYSGCRTGTSSITGVAFDQGGSYPAQYNGALFFADHSRNEIWAMLAGSNGLPDPSKLQSFVGVDAAGAGAGHPVDLKIGPGGDLFYVDMDDGTVHRITYDITPPDAPEITGTDPASPANDNNPKVQGTLGAGNPDEIDIYTNAGCQGSPAATGTTADFTGAGIAVAVPDDATTSLSAKAIAGGANASDCSNSIDYREDSTAPGVEIDSGPHRYTNQTSPSFAFSSSDATATFECRLDAGNVGPWQPCSSPQTYSGLADGSYVFRVRAVDEAGNRSATSKPFTVDTTAPTASIDSGPSGTTTDTSATFTFSSNEANIRFVCQLDGGPVDAHCTSPKSYSGLSPGRHRFQLRAIDRAGNRSNRIGRAWTISVP
jgi:glucose/arabinose dehydrogenase